MILEMLAPVLAVLIAQQAPEPPLQRCRSESQALNTAKAIATCQAAANESDLDQASRVDALRLLGIALIVEGEQELAVDAFKKMLALDPNVVLGADAGPPVQHALERARQALEAERAEAAAKATPEPPPPPASAPGVSGTTVAGWSLAGAGGAVALVSSVLAAGAVYDRFFNRVPCPGNEAASCVPNTPLLFGIYASGAGRPKFVSDSGAWIGVSTATAGLGALAVGAGVFLLMRDDEPPPGAQAP